MMKASPVISVIEPAQAYMAQAYAAQAYIIQLIPLEKLVFNRLRLHSSPDVSVVARLARSISEHGLLQPICVWPQEDAFEIIFGEHRVRAFALLRDLPGQTAAERLRYSAIPAFVRTNVSELEIASLSRAEDIRRDTLSSCEEKARVGTPESRMDLASSAETSAPKRKIDGGLRESKSKPSLRAPSAPQLIRVLQCEGPLAPPVRYSLAGVDAVVIGGGDRQPSSKSEAGILALHIEQADRFMSREHARLSRMGRRWEVEDNQSDNGTFLNGAPVKQAALKDGDVLEVGHTFFVYRENVPLREVEFDQGSVDVAAAPGLVTYEPQLMRDFQALARVVRSNVSVVVLGESGTGKEVVARAIHALSGRAGPFVGINCGALPETLIEAELFGYRKGAFSGATTDHLGLIRSAHRGTLFLDEFGDLPLASQMRFLRVLQERQVVPVGGTQPIDVDLRLCAATHRDVDALLAKGELREDLFARLSGLTIQLPPLRRRREDLGLLIAAMLRRFALDRAERFVLTASAARAIFCYHWPLNVRELEKCLQAAIVMATDNVVRLELLTPAARSAIASCDARSGVRVPAIAYDAELARRDQLVRLLSEHGGNISAVARVMGKARMQIRRWLQRYRIDVELFRAA